MEANLEVVVVTTLVTCLPTSNHRLPTLAHVGVGVPMLFRLDSATDPVHPFPVVLSFFFAEDRRPFSELFVDERRYIYFVDTKAYCATDVG